MHLETTSPDTTLLPKIPPEILPAPTRGPDPNRPTTWGSDPNPNPNRPTGRELTLTHIPNPNRPTTWGPDPNRPMGRELSKN